MSLTEKTVDFKSMEKEIFKNCCLMGCEMIKTTLESWDLELSKSRDRELYRHKGKRKTVIKTIMGEVEYERTIYETITETGKKVFIYLLDEIMGKEGYGFISEMLSEQIVSASCESSYRNASRSVSELTGQTISHTAAWKVVQNVGKRVDTHEEQAAEKSKNNQGCGKIETPVLFEEQDGIWINLQGKDRKTYGKNKEMKVAIAYDGAKATGKKRYELTNKVACANFETVGKFQKRKEGVIAETYNVDEIEIRFVNGDGANWIKSAANDGHTHFQLDLFHRNRAIRQWVKDDEMRGHIFELLCEERIDELLEYIGALTNSVYDEQEKANLLELLSYFTNNKDGLVPYYRRGLKLPESPEGKEYRRMGAMESNVFTLIGNRMKGRRACWSINGGNNLARLLCLKHTKRLSDTLNNLTTVVLPEKYEQEITKEFSSKSIASSIGKGYNGYHQATAPAVPEYKWLRKLGAIKI